MIDIRHYKPGRFAYLKEKPFVKELWYFLTDGTRVELMFSASQAVKPAIGPFIADIESRFGDFFSSPEYPKEEICALVNNMIKQILEIQGFEHIACGLCGQGRYFKSSGIYRKRIEDQK